MKRALTRDEIEEIVGPGAGLTPDLRVMADPDDVRPPDFEGWSTVRQIAYWNDLGHRYDGYEDEPSDVAYVIGQIFARNMPPVLAQRRTPV